MKNKIINILLITFAFLFISTQNVKASTKITVTPSTSNIVIGNTFKVNVTISSSEKLGTWTWTLNYDKSKFKLTSGNVYIVGYSGEVKSKSYSYTFKAIGTGSGSITLKDVSAFAATASTKELSISKGSATVKVITQEQKQASYSKNNNLKSLSINGYSLTPKFSSSTTSYKVSVGSNVTSIKINAKASDSKSSVSGTGKFSVSEGNNKFNIKVTAENGSVKTYTIVVSVVDPNPIELTINDKKYTVVKRESNLDSFNGFVKKNITFNEQTVPSLYNEINNYTLLALKDEDSNIEYFLYDEENKTYEKYIETSMNQMTLLIKEPDKEIKGYKENTIKINEVDYKVLSKDDSEFVIIYARDLLTGQDNYYTYDTVTNTVIRYNDESSKILKENEKKYTEKLDLYKKIIYLLSGETIIIFFILICILFSKIRKNKKRKKKLEKLKEEIIEEKEEIIEEKNEENEIKIEKIDVNDDEDDIIDKKEKKKKEKKIKNKKEVK